MRFSVAALHCLFSLAALSCKTYVASVLPSNAAVVGGDFANVAQASDRSHPHAVSTASVVVGADGSLLAREHLVHPHKMSSDIASEGDVASDQGRTRVVVGADGSLDKYSADDMTRANNAETSDSRQIVRQQMSDLEDLADDALVTHGSVAVSEHTKFDIDTWLAVLPWSPGPWVSWGAKAGLSPTVANVVFYSCSILFILALCVCCCRCAVSEGDVDETQSWSGEKRRASVQASMPASRRATIHCENGRLDAKALWKQSGSRMAKKDVVKLMVKLWEETGIEVPLTNQKTDAMMARLDLHGDGWVCQEDFEARFADIWEEHFASVRGTLKRGPTQASYGQKRREEGTASEEVMGKPRTYAEQRRTDR